MEGYFSPLLQQKKVKHRLDYGSMVRARSTMETEPSRRLNMAGVFQFLVLYTWHCEGVTTTSDPATVWKQFIMMMTNSAK
uniref:Uncharacterized protein n=1 Tax=Timema douglasi TaxID=61478 RepID=A0A7R8Z3E6_TIMDO|nr:unnamed protein product [Timema douglasi]